MDPARLTADRLSLEPEESRYLRNVLRLSAGATIEVRDGVGGVREGTLADKRTVRLGPRRELPEDPGPRVHLCFAAPKGRRADLVWEKATELGAASVTPIETARSVRHGSSLERWERMVREAARQCLAARTPEVRSWCALEQLEGIGTKLVADPRATRPISACLGEGAEITLLTGPEGGFTAEELEALEQTGWTAVSLGDRILRAETAPIVGLTIIRHLGGQMG